MGVAFLIAAAASLLAYISSDLASFAAFFYSSTAFLTLALTPFYACKASPSLPDDAGAVLGWKSGTNDYG